MRVTLYYTINLVHYNINYICILQYNYIPEFIIHSVTSTRNLVLYIPTL